MVSKGAASFISLPALILIANQSAISRELVVAEELTDRSYGRPQFAISHAGMTPQSFVYLH